MYNFLGRLAFQLGIMLGMFTFYVLMTLVINGQITPEGFVNFLSMILWVFVVDALYDRFNKR